jgi:hypothetical protein
MTRRTVLGPFLAALTLLASGLALTPAAAAGEGDADRLADARASLDLDAAAPLLSSDNVRQLGANPSQVGISGCFLQTRPLFVTSGLDSVRVYDVEDGARPELLGVLPNLVFENEAMNCGERRTRDGVRRFALLGIDLYQASPDQIDHVNVGGGEVAIVEVTDPANPRIVSRVASSTGAHTVSCVEDTDCRYAYTSGDSGSDGKPGTFSVIDLRKLGKPREVDRRPGKAGLQPFRSPTAGHKWNFDNAGFATHTGFEGTSVWDVDEPVRPRLVTTTGAAGRGEDARHPGYNDFIHHNSYRPHARKFRPGARPRLDNGNVLLVTEEDYEQTDCSRAGSFQTWWVKRLDGRPDKVVPLDKVELADLGNFPLPQGAFCSAHWFDYHPSGIVAVGYYGGGTQLLDVRDPRRIRSWGYAHQAASEVWDAMWLPVYRDGTMTRRKSNVVYSVDLLRGLDVYVVDVPGDGRGATPTPGVTASAPTGGLDSAVLPLGLTAGALAVALAVRRRVRLRARG